MELVGLEPTTSSLRTRRSPRLSYSPTAGKDFFDFTVAGLAAPASEERRDVTNGRGAQNRSAPFRGGCRLDCGQKGRAQSRDLLGGDFALSEVGGASAAKAEL